MPHARERGRPAHPDVLTPAEWRVVEAVRHGLRNREIARRQGVSLDAVKFHVANALAKLGLSGRHELRRWNGVRRDSHLFNKEHSMAQEVKLGALGQIARTVRDIAAARAWYGDVLGLAHLYSFGNLAFFDCGGVRLFLSEGEAAASQSILYFLVDDVRTAQASLAARGIEFTHAPHMIHRHADGTEEWMAFIEDNEGRPLAIMSRAAPAAG
ncbi:LuxR C-terminal-related transcriptional regulator [Scleromatobacter humisilvae]|uniref:LuxR C-terminal-related transcriptional regulator n=1 Tax=Scleromatobacter humisilvae TaxID=2897159 RepID=A0A9X2C161_9BURK|nr:LuxR C-terminal-related transcriptional regulator [Scleromatobacter humisilvae]MCK9685429.1 LuxR C-terminal-related transcriptional regulator [Scleromatobacter humisilvae]